MFSFRLSYILFKYAMASRFKKTNNERNGNVNSEVKYFHATKHVVAPSEHDKTLNGSICESVASSVGKGTDFNRSIGNSSVASSAAIINKCNGIDCAGPGSSVYNGVSAIHRISTHGVPSSVGNHHLINSSHTNLSKRASLISNSSDTSSNHVNGIHHVAHSSSVTASLNSAPAATYEARSIHIPSSGFALIVKKPKPA